VASPDSPEPKYPSMFLFFSLPTSGHTNEEVQQAMMEAIDVLMEELITDEELERVKVQQRAGLLRSLASNFGLADNLATSHLLMGDWRDLFDSLERINAVTAEDIRRVVRETFVDRNRTVGYFIPEDGGAK